MVEAVRVLIVAPAPLSDDWAGGISNFVRSFVHHMPDDFHVSIAGIAGRGEDSLGTWRELTLAGREVRFMAVAGLGDPDHRPRTPVKARAMLGLLKSRPRLPTHDTVLQVHAPAMDLPFTFRRTPIVRVVHNSPDNLVGHSSGALWRHTAPVLLRLEERSYRHADRVFFVDHETLRRYARLDSSGERMCYLPNGVDTDEFAPRHARGRKAARKRLAANLGVTEDGPWLLFCGRLDRQKDPELLVATFAQTRLLPGLEGAQLLIVGTGPLEESARQAARAAGIAQAVHFVGTVEHEQLPEVMAAADVLVLTSAYEAAPFVVLEALACGLPVVSTAVGEVPELVQHERTGWVSATHSGAELARGVAWAVAQPRDDIAARAATSMAAYRTQDVLAPFYEAHRILARRAAG